MSRKVLKSQEIEFVADIRPENSPARLNALGHI